MASHDISQEIQDNVLSCPICNNQLREPKALPCLHTYCCKCLQELARRAENGRRRFHCPECRKTVVVPAQGVQAFPTNYLVANVLEKVQQCKEEKKKQADKTDMCDVHKQEAQVVCYTCNVVVCMACLKSDHKEHVLKHIDQEKATKVKQVEKLIKETMHVSGDLSPVKQRLEEKHKEVRTQVESWTRVVIRRVKDQEKSLLEKLDQIKERKLEEIGTTEMQHDELKRKMRAAKLSAEEAINTNSNEQLLYKDILCHYSSLTDAMSERAEYHAKQAPLLRVAGCLKFEKSKVPVDQPLLGHIVEESDGPSGSKPRYVVRRNTSDNTNKADTVVRGRDLLVARDEQKTSRRYFIDRSENNLDDTVSITDSKKRKERNILYKKLSPLSRKDATSTVSSEDDEDDEDDTVLVSIPDSKRRKKMNTQSSPQSQRGKVHPSTVSTQWSSRRALRKVYPSTVSSSRGSQASPSASTSRSSPSNAARPGASFYSTSDPEDGIRLKTSVSEFLRLCNPELDCIEEEFDLAVIDTDE